GYIHRKRPCPVIVIEAAGSIGWREESCSDYHCVQAAVGQYNLTEHLLEAVAIRDVARNPDCRSAIADAAAPHSYSLAMSGNDLLRGFPGRLLIKIHTYNVRTLIDQTMRHSFADPRARADNHNRLTFEFLFLRQPAEFCLFQVPIFDVERFL